MKSERDSANLIAPPPVFFIVSLLAGVAAEFFFPTAIVTSNTSFIIGIIFSFLSLPFITLSLMEFYKAKTAFDARKTTTALITTGIFKLSRNPAYLSLVFFYLGLSFLINSIWILILLIPSIYTVQKFCIEKE